MSATMGRATARAPMEKPEALNAPLFRTIVEQLEGGGRYVVLELGAASTPMLELLGQFRCRVEIADLADGGIERLNAAAALEEGAGAALAEAAEALDHAHRLGGGACELGLEFDGDIWSIPVSAAGRWPLRATAT